MEYVIINPNTGQKLGEILLEYRDGLTFPPLYIFKTSAGKAFNLGKARIGIILEGLRRYFQDTPFRLKAKI